MLKAILIVLLAGVSSSAAAEWLPLVRSQTDTVYADPATVRRTGDMVKMWDIFDYKTFQVSPDGKQYMSSKQQFEYDCEEEKVRLLFFAYHSGNMGNGDAVYMQTMHSEWAPVAPATIIHTLWKAACRKR